MAGKQFARSDDFRTVEVRLSFAQSLFKARAQEGGKPKFGGTLIIPKNMLDVGAKSNSGQVFPSLQEVVRGVILAQWGEKGLERAKQGLIKSPFLAGDGKEARNKETGDLHPGMGPDVKFIRVTANEDRPPVVRGSDPYKQATLEEVYSGCYGFAALNAFAWNNAQNGDGVSFGIQYFQKTRDGEPIGGGGGPASADKWFEKIADEGEAPESTKSGAGAGGLFGD